MTHHVAAHLKRLKMPAVLENLELREREAREQNLGYVEFLSLLVQDEIASREANILSKRINDGSLNSRLTFCSASDGIGIFQNQIRELSYRLKSAKFSGSLTAKIYRICL